MLIPKLIDWAEKSKCCLFKEKRDYVMTGMLFPFLLIQERMQRSVWQTIIDRIYWYIIIRDDVRLKREERVMKWVFALISACFSFFFRERQRKENEERLRTELSGKSNTCFDRWVRNYKIQGNIVCLMWLKACLVVVSTFNQVSC